MGKYVYILNGKVLEDYSSIIGEKLINNLGEEHEVELIYEKDSEFYLKFKNSDKEYALNPKYYTNLKMELKSNLSIKDIVEKRKIEFLCHFTNIKNLERILKEGLITREFCDGTGLSCVNDVKRYDYTNAICTSISFPNYKMLYLLTLNNPDNKWVIIKLDSTVLWELNCGFFYTNAANSKEFNDRHSDDYKTVESFEKMFYSELLYKSQLQKKIYRSDLGIDDFYTTDPQAEVLIFENINKKYIREILYSDSDDKLFFEKKFKEFKHIVNYDFFKYRNDFKHW